MRQQVYSLSRLVESKQAGGEKGKEEERGGTAFQNKDSLY